MADEAVPGKVGTGFPSGIASRQRLRAAGRFATAAWMLAAVLLAASPTLAQTNDPGLTEQDLDCLRKQTEGGPDCVPGQAAEESATEPTGEDNAAEPGEFTVQGQPSTPES